MVQTISLTHKFNFNKAFGPLLFFFVPLAGLAGTADSTVVKNDLLLRVNYPLPESGITFGKFYSGIANVNAGFERLVYKKMSAGVFVDYVLFKTNSNILDIKSKMNMMSFSLGAGLQLTDSKKILFHPFLNFGYAFISFKGTDADGNSKPKFTEQGWFAQPSLFIGYLFSKKISAGLCASYRVIFQHFGNNSTLEDSNIRIADFGIGLTYKL